MWVVGAASGSLHGQNAAPWMSPASTVAMSIAPISQSRRSSSPKPISPGRSRSASASIWSSASRVGEHLPPEASDALVETLVGHGDVIAFSAAVPGQGGENHINERPLEFWRARFRAHGYEAFDAVRPRLARACEIEPWYRFNLVLYANAAGADRLPEDVAACRVPEDVMLREAGDLRWRLRRALVRRLPRAAVDAIARRRAAVLAMLHHARASRA